MRSSRGYLSLKYLLFLFVLLLVLYVLLINSEKWENLNVAEHFSLAAFQQINALSVTGTESAATSTSSTWPQSTSTSNELLERGDSPTKMKLFVIIVAGFRTGSTLLGEFFNQNEDIFYLFEPLHQNIILGHREEIPGSTSSTTLAELQQLYLEHLIKNCTAFSYTSFREQMSKVACGDTEENLRMFGTVECVDVPKGMMSQLCRDHDVVVAKTIRIRDLGMLGTFSKIRDYKIKVIHLLRDPRGVINSRRRGFTHFYLNDLEELRIKPLTRRKVERVARDYCEHEYDNLLLTEFMPDWLDGNYFRVTHDQISTKPETMLTEIYDFLDLEVPGSVTNWVRNLTNIDTSEGGFLTTRKNSSEVLSKWKRELSDTFVKVIEDVCNNLMEKLGIARTD